MAFDRFVTLPFFLETRPPLQLAHFFCNRLPFLIVYFFFLFLRPPPPPLSLFDRRADRNVGEPIYLVFFFSTLCSRSAFFAPLRPLGPLFFVSRRPSGELELYMFFPELFDSIE